MNGNIPSNHNELAPNPDAPTLKGAFSVAKSDDSAGEGEKSSPIGVLPDFR